MPVDEDVLRSARNALLFVLVALVALSTYQFFTVGGISTPLAVVWIVAVGGFYLSRLYYRRKHHAAIERGERDPD